MLRRSLRPSSSIASLSFCSSRASLVLLEHIKTWRNKLKSLLFEHIPETKLSGRYDSPVLDMRAGEAIADLERRGIFPFQQYNLQPDDYRLGSRGGATIYHSVHDHRIAEKAFELGFRDVDGVFNGQTPLLVTIEKNPRMTPYVNWLIAHGSSYTSRLFYTNTHINTLLHRTISHMLLEQLALSVHSYLQDGLDPEGACLDNLRLLSKVSIGDGCTCSCSKSSDGCYPMTIFISTFLKVYLGSRSKYAQDIHSYYRKGVIWICEKLLNFVAKKDKFDIITEAILRGLTFDYFTLLHLLHTSIPTELHGIRHTCCICLSPYYYVRYKDIKPSQDELETYGGYHEKDHVLLRKLDELVVEFTEQFSLVPYPLSEFIENCWFPRMNEVVHELSMSYSSQAEITEEEDDDSNEDSKVSDLDVVLKLPGAF
ncbi:hypothetical protein F4821DRAFT_82068 [Hypoxylon rubiginosum]|uniref:Uncharacterized protein n=1 Tax=Hypoxylon rubiginosum TaxID=110542 RepID=A0ACC0D810_9PEZI|nr:hypothetical protein F4821DRAFT_82068 [Hypoxylon rubiginosum]